MINGDHLDRTIFVEKGWMTVPDLFVRKSLERFRKPSVAGSIPAIGSI